ncbi:hypothetical protein HMN09_00366200 [Mycena chlorophos]|uniref:Macrofage activating glycoprotein n=1 Tax=Mycena chlorophos TaxID=658473 RepID=A0A8H6TK04_MYCCL|nr:hypothetical protein HMN09_00366200 [Mycena chlorophos]
MPGSSTLLSLTLLAVSASVRADYFSKDPLVDKVVPYNAIPYQVMTDTDDPRGFQSGYNQCNSSTENPQSLCQTMFVNHLDDFCLWAPPQPNTTISDSEQDEVAWCTKKGHGGRYIPAGAIQGIQMVQTQSYIQIAGYINQAMVNIGGTYGGELDSGGQDGEGNPMGGLVYTNAFPSAGGNNATYVQAQHWSFFIGDNYFCGKICDQTGSNPQGLCNNIYDRLGCEYNAPSNVENGTFTWCKGDDMTPVGTYVVNGATSVYTQPAESVSINFDQLPYTPTAAATSECTTFVSASLFTDIASVTAASGPSATGASGGSATGAGASKATGGAAGATGKASGSTTGSAAKPSGSSGAIAFGASVGGVVAGFAAVLAVL